MKKHRILTTCLITGATLGGISLLMAAQTVKDEGKTALKPIAPATGTALPADSSRGIICFGNVDVDGKLIPVFPRDFPQPSLIVQLHAKEEQKVKEGDILVDFDTANAEHDVAKAKAALARAQAAVVTCKVKVDEAEEAKKTTRPMMIERQTAAALAMMNKHVAASTRLVELRRVTNLNGGSEAEVRAVEAEVEGLRQAYEAERLGVEALKAANVDLKVREAQAGVGEAEAQVEIQKQTLTQAEDAVKRYGKLLAPCDGTIVRLECSKGMTVGAQTKAPLMIIQPKTPFLVRAEVEQEYTAKLKVGQSATMTDESDTKVLFKGKVARIAPAYLPKRSSGGMPFEQMNEQRVLECIIEIEGDTSSLRLGQKMRVKLID